jgi:uncharacterized protein
MTQKTPRRKIQVRESGVHGRGVYATAPIEAGSRIIEYTGERIDWEEAVRRHPHDPAQPNHTFYFHIEGGQVIDALYGGNDARWINHACEPNCEADEVDGRVFIQALRDIEPGAGRAAHAQAEEAVRLLVRRRHLPRHDAGTQAAVRGAVMSAAAPLPWPMNTAIEAQRHTEVGLTRCASSVSLCLCAFVAVF